MCKIPISDIHVCQLYICGEAQSRHHSGTAHSKAMHQNVVLLKPAFQSLQIDPSCDIGHSNDIVTRMLHEG